MSRKNNVLFYTKEEAKKLIEQARIEKLVYIDTGVDEVVARKKDLPDIIVDIYDIYSFPELYVYDFLNGEQLLTTFGPFLNKCKPNVREDIIERLVGLQREEIKVKEYKLIDFEDLSEEDYFQEER